MGHPGLSSRTWRLCSTPRRPHWSTALSEKRTLRASVADLRGQAAKVRPTETHPNAGTLLPAQTHTHCSSRHSQEAPVPPASEPFLWPLALLHPSRPQCFLLCPHGV